MDWAAFDSFTEARRDRLEAISSRAGDEYPIRAVINEAVELVFEFEEKRGALDLRDAAAQEEFLRWLYNRLVKWNDPQLRYSVRFENQETGRSSSEHWAFGDEDKVNPHGNEIGADPLDVLLRAEELATAPPQTVDAHESLAAAYVQLIHDLDNRMTDVARHLLISPSWCYQCVNRARMLAEKQRPLPRSALQAANDAPLGPWRRFKLDRKQSNPGAPQLEFDFGEYVLFEAGCPIPERHKAS